jgi:hypothetical protein
LFKKSKKEELGDGPVPSLKDLQKMFDKDPVAQLVSLNLTIFCFFILITIFISISNKLHKRKRNWY